jgi:hypothetical protein
MERDFFTKKRSIELSSNPGLEELEKWGPYCYLPLDVPRFDYPELVDWFFKNSKPSSKIKKSFASNYAGDKELIKSIDIFPNGVYNFKYPWTLNPVDNFTELFPALYNRLLQELPFKNIARLKLWSSQTFVSWHRDEASFVDTPSSFRIMLHDENPTDTLKLIDILPDSLEDFKKQFAIPRLPDTNTFVWNNLRTRHSSVYRGHNKILLIIDNYDLDIDRYKILMERSIEKYKDHAMVSNRTLDDYITPISSLPN